jgi:hypothetical protein
VSDEGWKDPVPCAACGTYGPHTGLLCAWRAYWLLRRTGLYYFEHRMVGSVPPAQRWGGGR